MNTQQLKCFVCVADKLNFTKAAEELFLSVPTVTHHIKNLEEELGTLLFHQDVQDSKAYRRRETTSMPTQKIYWTNSIWLKKNKKKS